MKNNKKNYIILILTILLVLYFSLKDDMLGVFKTISKTNILILLIAVLLVLLALAFKSVSYMLFIKENYPDFSFKESYRLTLIGQFLNGITPFQSGGQPFLIYMLKKDGKSISHTTSSFFKEQLSYQISIISLSFICIILNFLFKLYCKKITVILILIGFFINVIVLLLIIFIMKCKNLSIKIISSLVSFIGKFKIFKKIKDKKDEIILSINYFYDAVYNIKNHKINFFISILCNFINIILIYLVPFFVILSLGVKINIIYSIIAVSFVMLIGNFVPIPGASGGIEYSFVMLFGLFISKTLLTSSMLLWRFITYGMLLIIGFIVFIKRGKKI